MSEKKDRALKKSSDFTPGPGREPSPGPKPEPPQNRSKFDSEFITIVLQAPKEFASQIRHALGSFYKVSFLLFFVGFLWWPNPTGAGEPEG